MAQYTENKQNNNSGIHEADVSPKGWDTKKLKYICKINPSKSEIKALHDTEITFIPMENILSVGEIDTSTTKSLNEVSGGYTYFRENDIILAKVTPCFENDNIAIATGLKNGIGFGTTELHVLRVGELYCNRFIYYLLQSNRFKQEGIASMYGVGGLKRVPSEFVSNFKFDLPGKEKQSLIADFLDQKTTEIDSLITDKERLITLLDHQLKAIIIKMVTKGINPNVKMKNSDIEWIGEIPEHWEIRKIKHKFTIQKRIVPQEDPIVLSLTQKGLKIKDLDDFSGQHAESYSNYQLVNTNDFVMNSMDLLTGFVDCSQFNGVTSPDYRVFTQINSEECHQYFLYYFQMCYFEKIFYGHGQGVSKFGRWRLQTDVFKEFPIMVPPIKEQFEIAKSISEKTHAINEIIKVNLELIEKLRLYRQSLIFEAVTGKIDVRDVAAEVTATA